MTASLPAPEVLAASIRADPAPEIRALLAKVVMENAALRANLTELRDDLAAALEHHRSQEIDRAETLYRKILAKVPRHPVALHMLGVVELQRGHTEAAIGLIREATVVQPGLPEPFVNLGNALRLVNKTEEAVQSYRQAIALKPEMILAHSQLAEVLMHLGRYEAAITHLHSAIAIDPASVPVRVALATALRQAGRPAEAAQCWREAIALEPNRAESYYVMGLQFGESGEPLTSFGPASSRGPASRARPLCRDGAPHHLPAASATDASQTSLSCGSSDRGPAARAPAGSG